MLCLGPKKAYELPHQRVAPVPLDEVRRPGDHHELALGEERSHRFSVYISKRVFFSLHHQHGSREGARLVTNVEPPIRSCMISSHSCRFFGSTQRIVRIARVPSD